MIRYPFDEAEVAEAVKEIDRTWFDKAKRRTSKLVALGRYKERTSIWSTVKPVLMRLQMSKCVFCEQGFESPDYGTIESDLEHFRPKSTVKAWPDAVRHPDLQYRFQTGESQSGYFWLAYEITNYAASCKICNTTYKLSFFPVSAARGGATSTVTDLASEKPFLCYPIGEIDDDPEELITFAVTTAVPAKRSGWRRKRCQVIINFFGLNDRLELHRQRARMISLFGPALIAVDSGSDTEVDRNLVIRMNSAANPHAACMRAFKRLWETDRQTARRAYDLCRGYAVSDLGTPPPVVGPTG